MQALQDGGRLRGKLPDYGRDRRRLRALRAALLQSADRPRSVRQRIVPARPAAAGRPSVPSLELRVPPGNVHVGKVRFTARSRGELDKVTFFVDDRPVLSKRRPPYSVELDLGDSPGRHRVRVVGFAGGAEPRFSDGSLVGAVNEERYSRRKRHAGFPWRSVAWLLARARLQARELDAVVIVKPERAEELVFLFGPGRAPFLVSSLHSYPGGA